MHFYADDTILYSGGSILNQSVEEQQITLQQIQALLCSLKLVLYGNKTKIMFLIYTFGGGGIIYMHDASSYT